MLEAAPEPSAPALTDPRPATLLFRALARHRRLFCGPHLQVLHRYHGAVEQLLLPLRGADADAVAHGDPQRLRQPPVQVPARLDHRALPLRRPPPLTPRPSEAEAQEAMGRRLDGAACATHVREILAKPKEGGWPLAYALAWLSVAGGNSVIPPWVRHQFPDAGRLVRRLRDTACKDPACGWCHERHDARKELKRWFGFDSFRPEPADDSGHPLQQAIVEAAMAGKHVLGILPAGTGKSLCYQIPALSRYDKTGALTVVIWPLVALMADQVAGLEARGIGCCVTINGLLSMPERADALDRVRLGDAGILLISPEQLRARSLRRVLNQREIGAWVLDEAHCLSRWGRDFRPDYRYVGRFIREKAGDGPIPPVLCLTATAMSTRSALTASSLNLGRSWFPVMSGIFRFQFPSEQVSPNLPPAR